MSRKIVIKDPNEAVLIRELEKRNDIKAESIKRLLKLPDLTKKENSPVKILFDQIINLPRFKNFDIVDFPKIITPEQDFDLLNTPKDHPSRRETDTYYLDEDHLLRTQMTAFWSFYLKDKNVLKRLEEEGEIITQSDLKEVQVDLAKGIFGKDIEYKFLDDEFPYNIESLEMDIMFNGKWLEVNGAGLVNPVCLKTFGLDPKVYNGWAFGFGDRLAMIKMGISDIRILWSDDPRITSQFKDINSRFKTVSKYPSTFRDISFVIDKNINLNNYYEIVRDFAKDLIEQVKLIDEYENEKKFGKDKKSYTFRVTYRSYERTLTNEEVNKIQDEIREETKKELKAEIR